MLAKITLYDGTIYRIADKTTDTQDGIYLGRIKDELSLVSAMQEAGNAPATINLTIINHDDFIPHSKDLWAADVLLTNDNGVSWRGKINFCNFDADGNLYVTASEKTAPELELQLPDEVRQVYTIDEDFHQSSVTMTIPLVIGGTHEKPILVPTILIDKTQGIYLICVGEIREVVNVYSGSEKLPRWEYNSWRGTAEQPYHKGFAYVAIASGKRLNADGSYAEINVEVVGLKLGDFTEEECRNGALFLYYFLTTAATGINGWGCGIDPSEIDTASFQSAITLCNQLGYKLDGIMWLRQSAQSWIDQICQAIHGKYSINANGKRSLFIDYAGNASKKTFTASNMQVERYGKNSYTSVVYNKGILSYDYNPITGLFMQSAQYENAESIAQIGEQKFVGESYLIKDPTTALAVLEYTCKRSQTAAEAIEFKTDDIDTVLRAGDVITINRPDLSINNALYQIQNISITDYEASISAVKFDTSVFIVSGTPSSVNWGNDKAITPALTPAQATNLLLSTGFDINPDGTGTPYISGTFTVPDGGWLAAAVQYGIGANPNNWTELALITEGKFKLSPVNVGTVYSVRVRMITSTGHSDYITGQITATGDTTPPAEPTIAVNATDKTVTVQCGLDNPPYDMGGFQIYRKKSTEADSAYTLIAMVAANRGYASYSDYVSEYITYNYKAKSYDRSGNLSTNFSNTASVTVTGIQANDVAATALAMPTGSILRLSAKNCTTASIAEVNGVKDVSGNGNHGQAYGGVTVVNDADLGDCFSFDGSNGSFLVVRKQLLAGARAFTISFRNKSTEKSNNDWILAVSNNGSSSMKIRIYNDVSLDKLHFQVYGHGGAIIYSDVLDGKTHLFTYTADFDVEKKACLFVDGVKFDESELTDTTNINIDSQEFVFGNAWSSFLNAPHKGKLSDIRIYPRALSASEIKTLYMFPDDVTFGQMTADLIGANVIKAENLIKTEALITTTAQIDQAVVNNLNVSGNATFQAGLNGIQVGGRNLVRNSKVNKTNVTTYEVARLYLGDDRPTENAKVTIQIKGTLQSGLTYFNVYNSTSQTVRARLTENDKENGIYKKTFSWKIGGTSNSAIIIYQYPGGSITTGSSIEWVKLEYGNKATTWTPAPEDVDSDINTVQSNLDTVTTNIYSPNTTTINGGKITTGTITVSQLAANTITADKIDASFGLPRSLVFSLNFKSVQAATAGTDVPDMSGNNNFFSIAGTWDSLSKASAFAEYVLLDNTSAGRAHYVTNKKSITVPASGWTFLICAFAHANGSGEHILFDFKPSSGDKNRIQFRIDPDNSRVRIRSWNNSGTTESKYGTLTSCQRATYLTYIVRCTSTTSITVYAVPQRRGDSLDVTANKVTITLSNARSALTSPANYMQIGGTGSSSEATASIVGNIGDIQFFNRALSANELKWCVQNVGNYDSGLITADRIATDAIRGRNASGGGDGSFTTQGLVMSLAGNGWLSAKNFYLKSDGSASFKGAVTATSGKVGDFEIGTNTLNCSYTNSGVTQSLHLQLNNLGVYYNSNTDYIYSFISQAGINCSNQSKGNNFTVNTRVDGSAYNKSIVTITPSATTKYGLYVAGKARINTTDYTSDESTKKDFQDISTLDKLKKLRVCAWRFDEEKLVKKDNEFIDAENIKIEAENKAIDAENAEILKENKLRKNRKDGEPVELIPLKEHKKLREHRIADKNANHPLNIGCMAGEFNKAFGTNDGSEDCLSVTDTIGVCMRAIQELAEIVDSQKAEIAELKALLKNSKDNDSEKGLIEPSFDELLKDKENQKEEQK